MKMIMLALLVMTRWRPLSDLPFVIHDKKGEYFWVESNLVFGGRVSIRHFLFRGMCISFEGCNEVYMHFLFFLFSYISLMYTGLVTIYWHTLYLSFHIYMMMIYASSPISPCIVSFLSLYTCFFMCVTLFLFHTWYLDEFCLSVSERQVMKVYYAMNSLLTRFFKSLC